MRVVEICNAYDVGKSAVYDLLKLEAETGDIHPRTDICGRKAILCESDLAAIDQLIQEQRDITLEGISVARTVDVLLAAIPLAFASVMPSDILGWFDHCGYSASFL